MTTKIYTSTDSYTDYDANERVSTFGGEEDTWGANLTPEILNDPGFSVSFDADVGEATLRVDEVTVEVFFTLPSSQYDADGLPPWAGESIQQGCIGVTATGATIFVVVGENGLVKTSPDGNAWTEQTTGNVSTLRSAASREGKIIAVGDNGVVLTSTDGVTWVSEASETTEALTNVVFNSSQRNFVAAGRNGVIRTSDGNATWRAARL